MIARAFELIERSAISYQNQKEVAEGIKRAYKDVPGLKREDLFIVSTCRTSVRMGLARYLT